MTSLNNAQVVNPWIHLTWQKLYLSHRTGNTKSKWFLPVEFPRELLLKFYFDKVPLTWKYVFCYILRYILSGTLAINRMENIATRV